MRLVSLDIRGLGVEGAYPLTFVRFHFRRRISHVEHFNLVECSFDTRYMHGRIRRLCRCHRLHVWKYTDTRQDWLSSLDRGNFHHYCRQVSITSSIALIPTLTYIPQSSLSQSPSAFKIALRRHLKPVTGSRTISCSTILVSLKLYPLSPHWSSHMLERRLSSTSLPRCANLSCTTGHSLYVRLLSLWSTSLSALSSITFVDHMWPRPHLDQPVIP